MSSIEPFWIALFLGAAAVILSVVALYRSRSAPAVSPALLEAIADLRRDLQVLRTIVAEDLRSGRDESEARGRGLREEIGNALAAGFGRFDEQSHAFREEVARHLQGIGAAVAHSLGQAADLQKERLESATGEVRRLATMNAEAHERLRRSVEDRLDALRAENGAKLEEMRRTVDEKLQSTIEQRLDSSFKRVSEGLEQVFRSVGEMQTLASGVGDLKRVLTNVKTRGTWAEVALGSLLEQVMAPEQFGRNVEVRPGSGERVEFAIRLPGQGDHGDPVWLPIDAKFPSEDYERLLEASDRADGAAVETALKALEARIRSEGATICEKYVCPPHTTDFAVLYLPTEGLYAEVIRRPGLVDDLQLKCRIVVAGPTVLLAMLNSLRMGFRTLAIQKRSSEVWQILAAVKTEFGRYGEVLEKVKKKLGEASDTIDRIAVRRRQIDRKLSSVERLPEIETGRLLDLQGPEVLSAEAAE